MHELRDSTCHEWRNGRPPSYWHLQAVTAVKMVWDGRFPASCETSVNLATSNAFMILHMYR